MPNFRNEFLSSKFQSLPMPLSIRPFGGLFNPFSKSCSILCNHPAPTNIKSLIEHLKTTLTRDGKNGLNEVTNCDAKILTETDNIPEDLFRRYTDANSRPVTPSPTVTSLCTHTSAVTFSNYRRCITPEYTKTYDMKRKKIILDLRRSHSQETLCCKLSSETPNNAIIVENTLKNININDEKKPKHQRSEEKKSKCPTIQEKNLMEESKKLPINCINNQDFSDENIRRGKKRRKDELLQVPTSFHLSDNLETQVAALGPDSINPSTRPSLISNAINLLTHNNRLGGDCVKLKGSYLTDDVFQTLKTELDIDVIENTFGRYLNYALREAVKFVQPKPNNVNRNTKDLETLKLNEKPDIPRKFSKSVTRFDVPLNLKILENMSVLQYLSQYVWINRQRKQLYKRAFMKFIKRNENGCFKSNVKFAVRGVNTVPLERIIAMEDLPSALKAVLGPQGTADTIFKLMDLLDYNNHITIGLDFRTWCGVVSFSERLTLTNPNDSDSCDELEKADFNSLSQRLQNIQLTNNLRLVFDILKRTHDM